MQSLAGLPEKAAERKAISGDTEEKKKEKKEEKYRS